MPTDGTDQPDARPTGDRPDPATGAPPRIPVDLAGGLSLLAIAAVFLLNAGEAALDWIFPLSLAYALAAIAVYLVARGLLGFGDRTDTLIPILHGRGVDVVVFVVLAVLYVALARVMGFWIMSVAMIFTGSVYLDHARTRRRITLAAAVALAVCALAYVFLLRVFYVPVPRADWLPF